nr:GDYXXLXY domain-containing protein [Chloroflexota bacterium]
MSLPLKIAFWATVAGQIILLLSFIAVKEDTLRSGTSVLLETAPVDPRSILQGDYAILDYQIAQLPVGMEETPRGERLYVGLIPGEEGVWQSYFYTPEKPSSDMVFIRGVV